MGVFNSLWEHAAVMEVGSASDFNPLCSLYAPTGSIWAKPDITLIGVVGKL